MPYIEITICRICIQVCIGYLPKLAAAMITCGEFHIDLGYFTWPSSNGSMNLS